MMKIFGRSPGWVAGGAALLAVVWHIALLSYPWSTFYAGKLEKRLVQAASALNQVLQGQDTDSAALPVSLEKGGVWLEFKADSLVRWSAASLLPYPIDNPGGFKEQFELHACQDNYWLIRKYPSDKAGVFILGAIPVCSPVGPSSSYFPLAPGTPATFQVGQYSGGPTIRLNQVAELYLTPDETVTCPPALSLLLLGFYLFAAWAGWRWAAIYPPLRRLKERFAGYPIALWALFSSALALLFALMLGVLDHPLFRQLSIFEPVFPGGLSFGAILAGQILMLASIMALVRNMPENRGRIPWPLSATSAALTATLALSGCIAFLKFLLTATGEVFDFDNIFYIGSKGWATLGSITCLIISLYLFSQRLLQAIRRQAPSLFWRLMIFALAAGASTLLPYVPWLEIRPLPLFLILFLYLLLFDLYLDTRTNSLTWTLLWTLLFAGLITALLNKYTLEQDFRLMESYCRTLAEPRDLALEASWQRIAGQLEAGPISRNQLERRLGQEPYLAAHFQFIWPGTPLFPDKADQTLRFLPQMALLPLSMPGEGWAHYVAVHHPAPDARGILFLHRQAGPGKTYANLSEKPAYKGLRHLSRYSFAVFDQEQRVDYQGFIARDGAATNWPSGKPSLRREWQKGRIQVAFRESDSESVTVLMQRPLKDFTSLLSVFSLIFLCLLIGIIALAWQNRRQQLLPEELDLPLAWGSGFRLRIQASVIGIAGLSFAIMTLLSVRYFRLSALQSYDNDIIRKAEALRRDMEARDRGAPAVDSIPFSALAERYDTDADWFDAKGFLKRTSDSQWYAAGRSSPLIHVEALSEIKGRAMPFSLQTDIFGGAPYRSIYLPLRLNGEKSPEFLRLPYQAPGRLLNNTLSDYTGAMLSVSIFLLLVAGSLTILVANSITGPLTRIGERLRNIRVGYNEPLQWDRSDDEIGALVQAYNEALQKIEESVAQLRQTERESAWREMAKQVAHEIKNPLTPMKLSMQYLLHAYQNQPERAAQLLPNAARTIIEQIDGLTQIATEFSHFAQMPAAENSYFNLNDLLRSAVDLFRQRVTGAGAISLHLPPATAVVFADRNQVLRVCNNLLQNALQAIPEDRSAAIGVSLQLSANTAHVQVSDNGQGIPEAIREKVFYPNFTTKSSGMGLGLAICRNIVQQAGGNIYFETAEGEGTRFFVDLPLAPEDNEVVTAILAEASSPAVPAKKRGRPKKDKS